MPLGAGQRALVVLQRKFRDYFMALGEAFEHIRYGVNKLHLDVPIGRQDVRLLPGSVTTDLVEHLRVERSTEYRIQSTDR